MPTKDIPKFVRKLRIVKNVNDGKVLTWTPLLSKHEDYFNGWRHIYSDGSIKDEIDKSQPIQVDSTTASARERRLIEENAKLMEELANLQKAQDGVIPATAVDSPDTVPLDVAAESLIKNDLSMAALGEAEAEKITFRPEAEILSKTKLNTMKKEEIIVHCHDLDRTIDLPDESTRSELINLCVDIQERVKKEREGAQE